MTEEENHDPEFKELYAELDEDPLVIDVLFGWPPKGEGDKIAEHFGGA